MEISKIRGIPCLLWIMIAMILSLTGCKGSVKETEEIPATPTSTEGPLEIYLLEESLFQVATQGSNLDPTWSPDGAWIAFSSKRNGDYEIYLADARCLGAYSKCDQNAIPITDDTFDNWSPAWSPDSSKIAYTSFWEGVSQVFVADIDCILNGHPHEICIQQFIIHAEDLKDIRSPAWSPDGSWIAFASMDEANEGIYVSNSIGTKLARLTDYPSDYPEWSPDGNWIVYSAEYRDTYEIYLMRSDGTGQRRLTYDFVGSWNPTWSPDGRWIAYDICCFASAEVRIFDAACGMQSEGFDPDCYQTGIAAFPFEALPAWSPNGREMLFVEIGSGKDDIYRIGVMTRERADE